MFKKIISIMLAVMMIMSLVTVMATSTGAVTYESTKLYFDVSTTGWTMGAKDKAGFYIYGDDFEPIPWGGKKTLGVSEGDGIWSFDPAAKGVTLEEGVQYKIIFTGKNNNADAQTADLYFDTTCLGHCAECNGQMVENFVDSSKKSQVAVWKDLDPSKYGPVKGITSLGNVVGTCLPQGKTDEDLFNTWLVDTGAQGMKNAMKYTVMPGTKTAQQLVDDIGADLGLTKDFVQSAIEENQAGIEAALALDETITKPFDWSYDASTLPAGEQPTEAPHVHTPGEPTEENVKPATCKEAGSYDKVVYCTTCGEEISRETIVIGKLLHTEGEPTQENVKPASCKEAGSYDKVVYCTVCGEEISRETIVIGKLLHTEGEPTEENVKIATCKEAGSYDKVVYCTVCGEELSRETIVIGKLLHAPGEEVRENEKPATCKEAGGYDKVVYCTECGEELSRESVVIGKLLHTPGEEVKENEKPGTCTEEGSYDMVTYCTACGEELSRETIKTEKIPHTIIHKDEVPATATEDGMKEHYECEICGALFFDADGKEPATAEELVIKAAHLRGDADANGEVEIVDATWVQRFLAEMPVTDNFDEIAADADQDGEVDIVDATLIQRYVLKICDWDKKPPVNEA